MTAAMREKLTPAAILKGKKRQAEAISQNPKLRKGPENQAAKIWRLRSPRGIIYEFKNLKHFLRTNPDLFNSLDVQWVRSGKGSGMTCKAYGGLHSICPRHKIACGSWKGWTWWSRIERLNDGRDLLDRKQVSPKY